MTPTVAPSIGSCWREAKFYAAVGLAELGDIDFWYRAACLSAVAFQRIHGVWLLGAVIPCRAEACPIGMLVLVGEQ